MLDWDFWESIYYNTIQAPKIVHSIIPREKEKMINAKIAAISKA